MLAVLGSHVLYWFRLVWFAVVAASSAFSLASEVYGCRCSLGSVRLYAPDDVYNDDCCYVWPACRGLYALVMW
jgi:hypothetical protein